VESADLPCMSASLEEISLGVSYFDFFLYSEGSSSALRLCVFPFCWDSLSSSGLVISTSGLAEKPLYPFSFSLVSDSSISVDTFFSVFLLFFAGFESPLDAFLLTLTFLLFTLLSDAVAAADSRFVPAISSDCVLCLRRDATGVPKKDANASNFFLGPTFFHPPWLAPKVGHSRLEPPHDYHNISGRRRLATLLEDVWRYVWTSRNYDFCLSCRMDTYF
jgi:hypothetical protein